jgi:uncharacterized protein YceK
MKVVMVFLAATLAILLSGCGSPQEAGGDTDAAWAAGLETSIADTMNSYWAGTYENHAVSCPDVDLAQLATGDEFTCDAVCDECDGGATRIPSSVSVTYEGDGSCSWQEVLDPGATGPGASGSYDGPS